MNRRSLVIALVAALVLVGGVVWWVLARDGEEPEPPGEPTATAEPTAEESDPAEGPTAAPGTDDPGTSPEPTATADPTDPTTEPTAAPTEDPTAPPVDLEDPAEIGEITARLARIEAIEGEAEGPGEIAGPALRVTVELTNGSAAAADLTGVVVNLYHGPDAAPAELLAGSGSAWFEGALAPGATVTGVYVFTVPLDDRAPIQVTVFVTPDEPTVLFEGAV